MLIGLCGLAGSGKDTACSLLSALYDDGMSHVVRDAFADRLKVSAARALGFTGISWKECIDVMNTLKVDGNVRWYYPTSGDGTGGLGGTITGRQYLQNYGTEAHRHVFADDFWVEVVLPDPLDRRYGRDDVLPGDILVITDVRFENEAARVLECGGELWKIDRPSVAVGDSHISEVPLPDEYITRVIDNTGDMDHFEASLADALGDLFV